MTEFLTPEIRKVLEAKGQPETITRTRRGLVEVNPDFAPIPIVSDQKVSKEFAIKEWAVSRK